MSLRANPGGLRRAVLKAYGMTDCRLRVDFSGDCAVDVFDLLHVLHRMGNDCTTMSTCKSFVDMDHVYHANVGDGIYQVCPQSSQLHLAIKSILPPCCEEFFRDALVLERNGVCLSSARQTAPVIACTAT